MRGFDPVSTPVFNLYDQLRTRLLSNFHLFELAGVDIRWISVDGFDTRWVPKRVPCGCAMERSPYVQKSPMSAGQVCKSGLYFGKGSYISGKETYNSVKEAYISATRQGREHVRVLQCVLECVLQCTATHTAIHTATNSARAKARS